MEKGENKNEEENWTEEDEKTLNNLLASIESAENRLKEIEIEKAKIKEIAAEIEKIPEEEKPETSEKERTKGDEFQTNPIQNLQEKSGIPIATEVFNEKRSIKDVSGKEITKGDIVTDQSNQDWLVCGFIERKIAEKYLKPGKKDFILYANLAKYENGEVNFNARTSAEDGEYALKEKWQPKYRNGEIIKMGDIVKANVEKFMFEVYNKKLKVVGFNLDGFVSVEVLDNSGRKEIRAVSPSVLEIFHEKEESATEQKTGTEEQKESKKEGIEKILNKELENLEKPEEKETKREEEKREIKSYSVEFMKTKILLLLQNIKQIDEVKNLDIKGSDKEITLNTTIKSLGFNIAVQATLENKGDGIVVKNYKVNAKWPAKGKTEKALEPHLNKISELLRSYIEKEENKKVEKIWIENGELKAL